MVRATDETVRAQPTLRVGCAGHRDIETSGGRAAVLQDRVSAVLAYLWQTAVDAAPTGSAAHLAVVSPLAEGADRLVAHAALANGFPLHCPLPFARDEYERDFTTEASRREYRALLARAATVRELPGTRAQEGEAYAAVGRVVVNESDVLLAIWDGEPARGDGGTAQVIAEAARVGIPVVWIGAEAPYPIRVGMGSEDKWGSEEHLVTLTASITKRMRILTS